MILDDIERRHPTNALARRRMKRALKFFMSDRRFWDPAEVHMWSSPWSPLSLYAQLQQTKSAGVRESVTPSQA